MIEPLSSNCIQEPQPHSTATRTKCACAASLVRDIVERATITADRIEIRLGKQKQRPAHDDALRGLAGTMASPQIMCIRAKADIVEKPKPEPSH
jgi:hypothetical protein